MQILVFETYKLSPIQTGNDLSVLFWYIKHDCVHPCTELKIALNEYKLINSLDLKSVMIAHFLFGLAPYLFI